MAWLFDATTRVMLLRGSRTRARCSRRTPSRSRRVGSWAGTAPDPSRPFRSPTKANPAARSWAPGSWKDSCAHGSLTVYQDGWHECWTASDLPEAALLERWRVTSGHERTTQLFAVRLGEPDPALFAPLDMH